MKNLFKVLLLTFILVIAFAVSAFAVDVYIDGIKVKFDSSSGYPFVKDGRTLVPLRATMESFGATVDWDSSTSTAFVRKGTTTVRCKVGDYNTYRNNVKIKNDAAAVLKSGRTYLPIRVVLESFGAKVDWNGDVIVTSPGAGDLVYKVENTPSVTTNYWGIWNEAIDAMSAGKYQKAIDKIMSISKEFIKTNKSSSNAMLFKRLGECYSNLGNYDKASACFKREAYYCSITSGQHQTTIDANRRADLISTNTQIYVKNTDSTIGAKKYFGLPHEPKAGICLGAYAEGDTRIHNPNDPSKFYMDTFPELAGREMAAYLLYMTYGEDDLDKYESHFKRAVKKGKVMQIALQPMNGLSSVVENDPYLIKLAKDMEKHECDFMLRFAGEMNDTTSLWYKEDPSVFIKKFRIVADVFHKYAPSVPVIWAPNHYPPDTIDDYYPGDKYVDYVGISSYKMHQPVTDPLGQGVDRSRWSNQLDTIYSLYAHKKPIIIAEGGASYMDYDTWADITPFASNQIEDFYTYLPIKYPNVKYCFLFNADRDRQKFTLSRNEQYRDAYRKGIKSELFNTSAYNDYSYKYDYYELGNNVTVRPQSTELCAYITEPKNDISYVKYYIDDVNLGTSYGAPFKVNVDFSSYAGKNVKVRVKAYSSDQAQVIDYTVKVKVRY